MLLLSDPSLEVILVASMPLKLRLVLVVLVPLTEGEIFPFPLVNTGGRSALTPASAESRWVKLRVAVGTLVSSSAFNCRKVVTVEGVRSGVVSETTTSTLTCPTSILTSSSRGTAASIVTFATALLNPAASKSTLY